LNIHRLLFFPHSEEIVMRIRLGIAISCLSLASVGTGCTSTVGKVTLFSTRNVEVTQPHDRLPRAKESEVRLWLAFIPLGSEPSGLRAASDLLEEQNADYLTNVEVTDGGWSLLAVSMGWVTVEADPWRRSGVAAPRGSSDR
jgi:hypothetical protein